MEVKIQERPILFSTPMVQAILAGRKTMTRRTTNLDSFNEIPTLWWFEKMFVNSAVELHAGFTSSEKEAVQGIFTAKCPYGQIGDMLWVRESFCVVGETTKCYVYKASREDWMPSFKWKPSIHMPRAACRLVLVITDIRVERLQDISEEDAIAEGIEDHFIYDGYGVAKESGYRNYLVRTSPTWAKKSFETLWQSINGPASWDANPWVWVVEFIAVEGGVKGE